MRLSNSPIYAHDPQLGIVYIVVVFSHPEITLELVFVVVYSRTSDVYCVIKTWSNVISK